MPSMYRVKQLPESFFEAIEQEDVTTISRFLSGGIDLNATRGYGSKHNTPLTTAVATGNIDTVASLIKHGASVHQPGNVWGTTPLHVAVRYKNTSITKLLLESGADVNGKDKGGATPLTIACEMGDLEMTRLLLDNHAHVNHQTGFETLPGDVRTKIIHVQQNWSEEQHDDDVDPFKKNTAITKAAWSGQLEVVLELLKRGCDVMARTANGNTALHIAAREGHTNIVTILLENTNIIEEKNLKGETPLFAAVKKFFLVSLDHRLKLLQTIDTMIKAGCDGDTRNNEQHTLIYLILTKNIVNGGPNDEFLRVQLLRKVLSAGKTMSVLDLPDLSKVSIQFTDVFGDPTAWLTLRAKSPRSLQHQCRLVVWEIVRISRSLRVDDLPITAVAKRYLNLM